MKKFIPIAISLFMMAAPMFFTSCSNDDNLIPDEIGTTQPVAGIWTEPYHIKDASIEEVKAFMSQYKKGYQLVAETANLSSIQLVYTTGHGKEGILYSFTKNTGLLYSVVDTESMTNKSIVLDYLNSHYSLVDGVENSDTDILYTYTNASKSLVVTAQKVSDEEFNVTYIFVTK